MSLLMAILVSNQVDRHLVEVVLQNIELDFDLSDSQLGLLTGVIFALLYSVMGVPTARWADHPVKI